MTSFALGDVLSITTGRLVSRDHIAGVYRILDHMTGERLMTHQIPRAGRECKPHLLRQHPQLAAVVDFTNEAHIWRWLDEQEATFGATLNVEPLPDGEHDVRDPLEEACDMVGSEKVFVVNADDITPDP